MFNDQTDFSNLMDVSFEEFSIFIAALTAIVLIGIFLQIQKIKRRRSYEIPVFIELMNDALMRNFLASSKCCELKLKSYRSIYGIACCLDGFYKELKNKNKIGDERESGLTKILSKQISLVWTILYHPEITHLLYDTEETRISASGMAKVQRFKEQLHKSLLKYGKRVNVNKRKKNFGNTNGSSGQLVSTPVPA